MNKKHFKELLFNIAHYDGLTFISKTRDYHLVFEVNLVYEFIYIESLEQKKKGIWDISDNKLTVDQEIKLYESAIELKQNSDYQIKCNEQEYNERWK